MLERAMELLDREVAGGRCHGYALAVGRRDEPCQIAVGGTLGGKGTPAVSPHTRFDLDCVTEAMVAGPLCWLALEKGLLTLGDPIGLYVDVPGSKKAITLWHLLTHTSGMDPSFLLEPEAQTPENSLKAIFARPLGAEVGKRAKHSGVGYIALGQVLEAVYAMPLDKAAKKFIFDPLGMKRTGFLPTGGDIAHCGADSVTGQPRVGEPSDENARFLHGVTAQAGLFADVADVSRFLGMLACGGMHAGKPFLTQESVALATRDHTPGMKEAFGLGLRIAGRENSFLGDLWPLTGYGQTGYSGASVAVDPGSGLTVALLQNRAHFQKENPELLRLRRVVHNSVLAQAARKDRPGA